MVKEIISKSNSHNSIIPIWSISVILISVFKPIINLIYLPQASLNSDASRIKVYFSDVENQDKIFWSLIIIIPFLMFIIFKDIIFKKSISTFLFSATLIILYISISWEEVYQDYKGVLWFGFNESFLIILVVISILLILFLPKISELKVVSKLIWPLIIVLYLPSVIQTPNSIIDSHHTKYIFNEFLLPVARGPFTSDFIFQYTNLLGYPLFLFGDLVRSSPDVAFSILINFYVLLTLILIVKINKTILPSSIRFLAPLLTIPLILVKVQPPDTKLGSITALYSSIPVRILLPIITAVFLLYTLKKSSNTKFIILGFLTSITIINNLEFGLSFSVALSILLIVLIKSLGVKKILLYFFALFSSVFTLIMIKFILGDTTYLVKIFSFILTFNSGFGSHPIPLMSIHLFIVSVFILGFIVSLAHLGEINNFSNIRLPLVILFLFSLWGIISFGYFVGRSIVSGQLQIFLVHTSVIIVALFAVLLSRTYNGLDGDDQAFKISVLILVAFSFTSILYSPSPQFEIERLARQINTEDNALIRNEKLDSLNEFISTNQLDISEFHSLIETDALWDLLLGLEGISPISLPREHNVFGGHFKSNFCDTLILDGKKYLLVEISLLGPTDNQICEAYNLTKIRDENYVVFERIS